MRDNASSRGMKMIDHKSEIAARYADSYQHMATPNIIPALMVRYCIKRYPATSKLGLTTLVLSCQSTTIPSVTLPNYSEILILIRRL